MLGGKNKQPLGYTIIEVMIVLAVSGVMFVIASNFISGKQERSSFTAGVNEMASEIQDVVEQVSDGRYSDIPVNCQYNYVIQKIDLSGIPTPLTQGTNSSCVFLGKIIRIPTGANFNSYSVISLAGGRLSSTQASSSANAGSPSPIDSLTTTQTIPQNLITSSQFKPNTITAYDSNGARSSTSAFGFIQSQGALDATTGSFQSGSQTINLIYINNLDPSSLYNQTNNSNLAAASKVDICLTDGTQLAKLTVGTNNAQLSVNITHLNPGALCP